MGAGIMSLHLVKDVYYCRRECSPDLDFGRLKSMFLASGQSSGLVHSTNADPICDIRTAGDLGTWTWSFLHHLAVAHAIGCALPSGRASHLSPRNGEVNSKWSKCECRGRLFSRFLDGLSGLFAFHLHRTIGAASPAENGLHSARPWTLLPCTGMPASDATRLAYSRIRYVWIHGVFEACVPFFSYQSIA